MTAERTLYYQRYPHLEEKLRSLPASPGVYLMKDAVGEVIYVGKAVSLRSRVRSYFQDVEGLYLKTALLVEKVADIETIVVATEKEALILESQLIKQYMPHYNILLRDDKHYPYLRLTLEEDYPRLVIARRSASDGSRYFGPYPQAGGMHNTVALLQKIFPLRQCSSKKWPANHRPCLNYQIGLCKAPCAGKISREDYLANVEGLTAFLKGENKQIVRDLEQQLAAASDSWQYEEAARLRDLLHDLREVQLRQDLDRSATGDSFDVIGSAVAEQNGVVQVFFVREGKVIGREPFFMTGVDDGEDAAMIGKFLLDYYGGGDNIPRKLYLSHLPQDDKLIGEALADKAAHKIELTVPQRGDKKRLLNLAQKNAELLLGQYLQNRERREQKTADALEALKEALALAATPARLECFDISHFQGSFTVASMVVFEGGVKAPKLYRRFRIKTVEGVDDFASLKEAVSRRLDRGLEERQAGVQPLDFGRLPDLLLIDGGKGQLSAVREILPDKLRNLQVISLAKENEEIYLPGQSLPLILPRDNPGLQLLQQLRDEAHRFAITYHRALRGKAQTLSALDDVPGIGPARRQRLLQGFGSLKAVKAASVEELAAVPTMTAPLAKALYQHLHSDKEQNKS